MCASVAAQAMPKPLFDLPRSAGEQSEPLVGFTYFSKLPTELRLEIWSLTMLPRTVDIHSRQVGTIESVDWQIIELYSPTPVPATLQVCQESRREALRTYKLCFGTHMLTVDERKGLFGFARNPRTYFSYEMDTVNFKYAGQLDGKLPVMYMTKEDLHNIRHIRADWCVHVSKLLIMQLLKFKNLDSFTLSWFWHNMPSCGIYDDILLPDVEITESNYQSRRNRPDIAQFMDAFITARDIFAPGYRIPLLRVRSLNNNQFMDSMLAFINEFHPQQITSPSFS